jgi:hypothetical protein
MLHQHHIAIAVFAAAAVACAQQVTGDPGPNFRVDRRCKLGLQLPRRL